MVQTAKMDYLVLSFLCFSFFFYFVSFFISFCYYEVDWIIDRTAGQRQQRVARQTLIKQQQQQQQQLVFAN